ncbi:hypothetical protein [Streptomyces sp. NPDC058953]
MSDIRRKAFLALAALVCNVLLMTVYEGGAKGADAVRQSVGGAGQSLGR